MKKKSARKTKRPAKKAATKPKAKQKSSKRKGGRGGSKVAGQSKPNLDSDAENFEPKSAHATDAEFPYSPAELKALSPIRKALLAHTSGPTACIHQDAMDFVESQIAQLNSAFRNLAIVSLAMGSRQAYLASARLADFYVTIGSEYHRQVSTKKRDSSNTASELKTLLKQPEFRYHFDSLRKVGSDHEGKSTNPTMQVVTTVVHEIESWSGLPCVAYQLGLEGSRTGVHCIYCDAIERVAGRWARCGVGSEAVAESWWSELIYPRIRDRWDEFLEIYGDKLPRAIGGSGKRLKTPKRSAFKRAFDRLWAERKRRFENDPEAPPRSNLDALARVHRMHFRTQS